MNARTAITPTRADNYPEWYQQVIKAADMAEVSPVRGCMIIKPWGYALWEQIQRQLDDMIKATGHENIYCPLFIPLSFMEKEAAHVEGFAKECAVVTHSKLVQDDSGHLVPASPLEEPLVVRPTSEAIIGDAFSRWIQSYRDLPLCVNQWANIVRWEMRTRMFLRTSEFLWQEGHTAHATEAEARSESRKMLDVYVDFVQNHLAMPVLKGEKSASERFPGAEATYCIEAMMQDKKALQAGTSHFLGQSFAKAFDIKYSDDTGAQQHVWTTSWGVSTRLIGGIIMTHGDDDGLILPPRVAPQQIVIMPIVHKDSDQQAILDYCDILAQQLRRKQFHGLPVRVKIDTNIEQGGKRAWTWVKKGVPIRLEIGGKELAEQTVTMAMRHLSYRERNTLSQDDLVANICDNLDTIQQHCYKRALDFQQQNTKIIDSKEDFYAYFADKNKNGNGFALAHWNGSEAIEQQIKKDLKVTIRVIPDDASEAGICPFTGEASAQRVVWAKAY
jgi:prolyl-tRNA synthetase